MKACLTVDPQKRMRAEEMAAHPWITSAAAAETGAPLALAVDGLKKYMSQRTLTEGEGETERELQRL